MVLVPVQVHVRPQICARIKDFHTDKTLQLIFVHISICTVFLWTMLEKRVSRIEVYAAWFTSKISDLISCSVTSLMISEVAVERKCFSAMAAYFIFDMAQLMTPPCFEVCVKLATYFASQLFRLGTNFVTIITVCCCFNFLFADTRTNCLLFFLVRIIRSRLVIIFAWNLAGVFIFPRFVIKNILIISPVFTYVKKLVSYYWGHELGS